MFLAWLLKNVIYRLICGNVQIPVRDIIYDSRKDVSGAVFVCLKGFLSDGHDYALDVMERGVRALVVQQDIADGRKDVLRHKAEEKKICLICVPDTRQALSEMSRAFFGYPEKKLTLIGITGTKGKTTAAGILKRILDAAGICSGLMGTMGIWIGKRRFLSENTTPESYVIQKYLRMMVDDGCKAAVMEVSSQALMCQRVWGMFFDYAIFTNISPDHIGPGEHRSLDDYIYWKGRLFCHSDVGIVNGTDETIQNALKDCGCCLETFGILGDGNASDFDWEGRKLKTVLKPGLGTRFVVRHRAEEHELFLSLPGKYNVYNALPVIAVARHMGIAWECIQKAVGSVSICGRCEVLKNDLQGCFILDYAHNGKSLETILKTLREYEPKRLICIFGCGGNRSRVRRTDMARAAALGADHLIITTDNPRYEAPMEIIHDIEQEIVRQSVCFPEVKRNGFYEVVEDRRLAIRRALEMMRTGDIVLLAGKGHETYQEIAGKRYPFDEHEIVQDEMVRCGFVDAGEWRWNCDEELPNANEREMPGGISQL